MSDDSYLPQILSYVGAVFLGGVALAYFFPPAVTHVTKRSPPGIVGLGYAVLTAYALVSGVMLITSDPLLQTLRDYLATVFQPQEVHERFPIVLFATFASLAFVLANLVRTYFN